MFNPPKLPYRAAGLAAGYWLGAVVGVCLVGCNQPPATSANDVGPCVEAINALVSPGGGEWRFQLTVSGQADGVRSVEIRGEGDQADSIVVSIAGVDPNFTTVTAEHVSRVAIELTETSFQLSAEGTSNIGTTLSLGVVGRPAEATCASTEDSASAGLAALPVEYTVAYDDGEGSRTGGGSGEASLGPPFVP